MINKKHSSAVSMVLRGIGSTLCPTGKKGRLSVLIYHRVLPEADPLLPDLGDAQTFKWQMESLAAHFNVLPLGEAIQRLRSGSLPARAACITFDDGYADNVEVALPILQEINLPATFFIATGFLDGGRMWNDSIIEAVRCAHGSRLDLRSLQMGNYSIVTLKDRYSAINELLSRFKYLPFDERDARIEALVETIGAILPNDLMMKTEQVQILSNTGMEIGAHTVNHPILMNIGHSKSRSEISGGKDHLEEITGRPVRLFAYPNGKPGQDYDAESVKIVKELGFSGAVSTAWGVTRVGSDYYQLPRFTPWDKTPIKFILRLLQNCTKSGLTVD